MSDLIYSTRREFIQGTLGTLSVAATMPAFLGRAATVLAEDPGRDTGRILVVVQLAGGNDGLNTVVPFAVDGYYRQRPRLAIAADDCLKLNDQVGLHPELKGFKALFDDGRLAVVQGVGYPNPNRSHFRSMDIWHTADASPNAHSGWLGRYFDSSCQGADPPDPQSGVALMSEAPLALAGERFSPLAFEDPERLRWKARGPSRGRAAQVFEQLNTPGAQTAGSDTLAYLERAALDTRLSADAVRTAARGAEISGRRGSLQARLALVARMIQADFPTRVYYVSMPGFDTHANQSGRHQQLMRQLGSAMKWFMDELKRHKLHERVLVMSFSEFGRRVGENASGGTDHGAAAPMFLLGSAVKPGVHQAHPSLEQLDRGDLVHGCDFRQVYAAVLRGWMQADDRKILERDYKPLKIV